MNYIPKGFLLKFHHNTLNSNYSKILKKCSRLLMTSTLGYYKKLLFRCYENYNSQLESVRINWSDKYVNLIDRLHNKYKSISFILSKRRLNKFHRDGLDIRKAIMLSRKIESNFQKLTEIGTNSNITDNVNNGQNMPSYDPIHLDKNNNLSDGLKSLCSKGPSHVPVPPHYNWLELQKNFDLFRNRMRTRFLFSNKESSYEKDKHAPPIKKASKWRPSKTNSHQLETFLSLVEKDLFEEILKKNVKDNLLRDERLALIE